MIYFLLILINAPNILNLFYSDGDYFINFVYPFFLCFSLVFLFPKKTYILFLCALPLSFAEAFYIFQYKKVSDEQIYAIIAETNFSEAVSWVGFYGFIGFSFAFVVMCIFIFYKNDAKKNISFNWMCFLIFSNIAIFICINSVIFLDAFEDDLNVLSMKENKSIGDTLIGTSNEGVFFEIFPWGIPSRMKNYLNLREGMKNAKNEISQFKFGATQDESRNDDVEIFVLVIGETGRPDRWSLNGYERLTNPKLSKIDNLVSFTNVITNWAWTRMSVPIIITRKPPDLIGSFFPEKSLVSAFKEAGFWTAWLSTQGALGLHESAVALHASEANEVRYINPASYLSPGSKDMELFPFFKEALNNSNKKKFIVLHTLGSHYNYLDRISEDYEIFSPSMKNLKSASLHNKNIRVELNNSYDNTVVYVDDFLNQLIKEINSRNSVASIFYIADHGENIFDNKCDKSGHGHNTDYDYRVAAMWWGSDLFVKKYPEKKKYAEIMRHKPWGTENIFETMLDLSGVSIENNPRKNKSIISENFFPGIRKLQSGFDFDNSPRGLSLIHI